MDVYIYKLDLDADKPIIEKFPAIIREGNYGYEVIRLVGPIHYSVWHSEFDTDMLGVVNEPLDNIVEVIVKRDEPYLNIIREIKDYLDRRTLSTGKRLEALYRGYGALAFYITNEIKSKGESNE